MEKVVTCIKSNYLLVILVTGILVANAIRMYLHPNEVHANAFIALTTALFTFISSIVEIIKVDRASEVLRQERMNRGKRIEDEDDVNILRAEIGKLQSMRSGQITAYGLLSLTLILDCIGITILLFH